MEDTARADPTTTTSSSRCSTARCPGPTSKDDCRRPRGRACHPSPNEFEDTVQKATDIGALGISEPTVDSVEKAASVVARAISAAGLP